MKKLVIVLFAILLLTGCTTTNSETVSEEIDQEESDLLPPLN